MKHPHTQRIAFAIGAFLSTGLISTALAQSAHPIVITPPAVKDGSNWSRAPFPAARQFDDVKAPDTFAIDQIGANSAVANIEPLPPAARVAVMQPAAPAFGVEPGLLPTGRTTVVMAAPFQSATYTTTIRSASMESRNQIVPEIETRLHASEESLAVMNHSKKDMSAEGRQAFEAAEADARQQAKALHKSLRTAKNAKDAQWEAAREQLASDYDAYAATLARIDAASGAR
jgi:hypothetical protein